jgi:hypothetical protein
MACGFKGTVRFQVCNDGLRNRHRTIIITTTTITTMTDEDLAQSKLSRCPKHLSLLYQWA